MALSHIQLKKAKPREKLFKLSDGGGLQLWIHPAGARRWRLAYRFDAKQKVLALGVYPGVGLKDAREARDAAKAVLAGGRDPSAVKKIARATKAVACAHAFGALADELVAKKRREARAGRTLEKVEWLLGFARPSLTASAIDCPCAVRTSTFGTISSGLCRFLIIPNPPQGLKAILHGGPFFRGRPHGGLVFLQHADDLLFTETAAPHGPAPDEGPNLSVVGIPGSRSRAPPEQGKQELSACGFRMAKKPARRQVPLDDLMSRVPSRLTELKPFSTPPPQ